MIWRAKLESEIHEEEGEEEGLVLEYSSSWIVMIQDSERLWRDDDDDCVN